MRTVKCEKFEIDLEGLEKPPFPGEKGQYIFDHISKKAWQQWLAHQTLLINEKHLNVMEASTQTYLTEQRQLFLTNQPFDRVDGFVPEKSRE